MNPDLEFSEMKRRKMETPTNRRDPSSPSPAAAADPRWVMLNCYGCGARWDTEARVIADAKTFAESCTSTGRHFRVSMGLAPPPAFSYLYHAMVDSSAPSSASSSAVDDADDDGCSDFSKVVAAHGDSVLFVMSTADGAADCFVYWAASAAGGSSASRRPPRLTLLPDCHVPNDDDGGGGGGRSLNLRDTGILRRGEDELLVAQLDMPFWEGEPRGTADLFVLRVLVGDGGGGGGGWELKKDVPIVHERHGGKVHVPRHWWETVAVIPVGDRYLCWLNYLTGFLFCDMAASAVSPPKLRYVRLPADLADVNEDDEEYDVGDDPPSMKHSRNMCAAGAAALRLVSVDSRCSCGRRVDGCIPCKRSRFAFTVTTWTLELRSSMAVAEEEEEEEPMRWVRDGVLDCDELWALPEYGGLPRVPLEYPVVSSDDPDVVCFRVCNDYSGYLDDEHRKEWLLEVDTRRKKLLSVLPIPQIPIWKKDSENIQAKFHY